MMDRRLFLKWTGAVAVAFFSRSALGRGRLDNPLISVPVEGRRLDEKLAGKVRKLAEYVITIDKKKGLVSYDPNHNDGFDSYQSVRAVMVIDEKRYTVWVANHDERAGQEVDDTISLWIRPKGAASQNSVITLTDHGLDGLCDSGIISKDLNDTGERLIYRNNRAPEGSPEGFEHRYRFQKLYVETLDKLIAFYEGK